MALDGRCRRRGTCSDGLGECTTNDVCTGTFCFGSIVQCPDADNNKCTPDVCNPLNGQCVTLNVPTCGDCETCDGEGACVPANDGATCDDGNQCTGDGKCQTPQTDPVTYPFKSYDGDITFTEPVVGERKLDFNTEGLVHIGLLPELIEDARRDAVDPKDIEPLFRSAEAYIRMWERAEERAKALGG